jgi:hypothetical protein
MFWSRLYRSMRGLAPVLILMVPLLPNVLDGLHRASLTTLGRDQGIFQYIAWAIGKGEVDYRDVRDVNGPLTHLVHVVLLAFGGRDEHRFRVIDLVITGISFAILGGCLPGIGRVLKGRKSAIPESDRAVTIIARIGWAAAAWAVLSGQLLNYLYWDLAQRETFFDWFLLPAVGLQLVAQDRLRRGADGKGLLALSGALVMIPCFGKPTYILFVFAQMFALMIDEIMLTRRQRLFPYAAGMVAGAAIPLFFLVRWGDASIFARITLHDVPVAYRFMMTRTAREILALTWGGPISGLSLATCLVMIALIVDGSMPRRAIGIALLPVCGVLSVLWQSKGFPYHFHPVSAGLYVQWLALCVWAWERFANAPRGWIHRIFPLAAAAALAGRLVYVLPESPHLRADWILARDAPESRQQESYFANFRDRDFFPFEIRQAAAFLKEHTKQSDRVQTYGMDPYVLFLAERLSATPYIYAYDLNADAAIRGSWLPTGPRPDEEQARAIKMMRDDHEMDLLERIKRSPPAAFVFFDRAPLLTYEDAVYDFHEQCAVAADWVDAHYRQSARFREIRVFLRNDLAGGLPEP